MEESLLDQILKSSKGHPLHVQCGCSQDDLDDYNTGCYRDPVLGPTNPRPGYAGMGTHGHRLESLSIDEGADFIICGYLALPLPSLKRLSIHCYEGSPNFNEAEHGRLFGGERPALRELSLKGYRLPLDALILDELRSFRTEDGIRRDLGRPLLSNPADILLLLSRSPLLENLAYIDIDVKERVGMEIAMNFASPIFPPRIKKLSLLCFSGPLLSAIFRSIVPHPSGVETVDITCASTTTDSTLHAISRFMNLMLEPFQELQVRLCSSNTRENLLSIQLGSFRICFRDVVADRNLFETLDAAFGILVVKLDARFSTAIRKVQLYFELPPEDLPMKVLSHLDNVFPNISHLHLHDIEVKPISKLLKSFSSAPRAFLSSLAELDIDLKMYDVVNGRLIDALEEFLTARNSVRKWSLARAPCSDVDFERLERLEPPGDLYSRGWNGRPAPENSTGSRP